MDNDTKFHVFMGLLLAAIVGGVVAAIVYAVQPVCVEEYWDGKDWQCTRMSDEPQANVDCTVRFRTRNGAWECGTYQQRGK